MATSYGAAQDNWLQKDLVSQTQKNSVDYDLSSKLAQMLRDRTTYQNQSDQSMVTAQRGAQDAYRNTAESYAARGLSSSTPYIQADDRAFQTAQTGFNDIRTQLADYLGNYDAGTADAKMKAEQQKQAINADALSRYAQQFLGGFGG